MQQIRQHGATRDFSGYGDFCYHPKKKTTPNTLKIKVLGAVVAENFNEMGKKYRRSIAPPV